MDSSAGPRSWTLLTTHGRVLIEIARMPDIRMRDIAAVVGITERAAQGIVAELEETGYVSRTRVGRRNRYTVDPDRPFRHSAQADFRVGELFKLLAVTPQAAAPQFADLDAVPPLGPPPAAPLESGRRDAVLPETGAAVPRERPGLPPPPAPPPPQ